MVDPTTLKDVRLHINLEISGTLFIEVPENTSEEEIKELTKEKTKEIENYIRYVYELY